MRRWQVLYEPAVPILLLASIVHAVRQNLFDLLLFGGTAVLIIVDMLVRSPSKGIFRAARPAPTGRRGDTGYVAAGVVGVAAIVAIASRDSTPIRIFLVVCALAALVVIGGTHTRPSRRDDSVASLPGWPVWAIIGVIACLWELTSFSFQQADPTKASAHPVSDVTHPAASDLIGPLLESWQGRAVFLVLWLSAGVWLLRRIAEGRRGECG